MQWSVRFKGMVLPRIVGVSFSTTQHTSWDRLWDQGHTMMNVDGKIQRRGQMKKLKKRVKGNSLTRVTRIACLRIPSQRRFISGRWGPSWGWMSLFYMCTLSFVLWCLFYLLIISRYLDLFLKVWTRSHLCMILMWRWTKSLIPPPLLSELTMRTHMEPNCIRKVLAFVLGLFCL